MNQLYSLYIIFALVFVLIIIYTIIIFSRPDLIEKMKKAQKKTSQAKEPFYIILTAAIFLGLINNLTNAGGYTGLVPGVNTFLYGLVATLALSMWIRGYADVFSLWPIVPFVIVSIVTIILSIGGWLEVFEIKDNFYYAILGAGLGAGIEWWYRKSKHSSIN